MAGLPPTTSVQRQGLTEYSDLQDILRFGFISTDVKIGRVFLSLRSMGPWDRQLLNRRILGLEHNTGADRQFKIWVLSQITWMVDGHFLLQLPELGPTSLYQTYSSLSTAHINKLFGAYLQIRTRYYKAFEALESFCFEHTSRNLWVEGKQSGLTSISFRGFEAPLGINEIQRSWMLFNYYEDRKEDQEHNWSVAKLIASSNAPKGIEKLNSTDKSRREAENSRRQNILDRFYYRSKGVLDPEDRASESPVASIIGGSSPEELEEEMRRWILGEKDEHDIIVENYKRHISENFARQLAIQEAQVEDARKVAKAASEDETAVALVGLTLSELRDRLEKEGYDPHTSTAHFQSKGREYLYRRYLEKAPTTGTLSVDEDGKIVSTAPPAKQEQRNLDLSNRNIEFGGD